MSGLSTIQNFSQTMEKLARELERSPRDIAKASAQTYTKAVRSELSSVTNNFRLRNVGKRGARIGVSNRPVGNSSYLVYVTGPEHLIERDTTEHVIPRATRSRRLRTAAGRLSYKRESTGRALNNRTPLYINGRWVTGPVTQHGTRGKHPFEKAADRVEREAFVDAANELFKHLKLVMGA